MIGFFTKLSSKAKKIIIGILILIFLAAMFTGIYVFRVLKIRATGVNMVPTKDSQMENIHFYLQNDPLWADELIGSSSYSMGGSGCLVSSVASGLSTMGIDVTPQELNLKLTEIDGFDDANLIWLKLNELYPEVDYKYSRIFSVKTIEKDLEDGLFPIIKVRYRGKGIYHWLVVLGAKDGVFWVSDPLDPSKQAAPLSNHGNKVYAYRTLIPS